MRGNPQRFCAFREGKVQLEVTYVIGKVVGADESYSTRVHGGQMQMSHTVSPWGSHAGVSGRPIESTVTKHSQLFLLADNGEELDLKLVNCDVGFRPGHRVTIVIGNIGKYWAQIGIINHDTSQAELWKSRLEGLLPTSWSPLAPLMALVGFIVTYWAASSDSSDYLWLGLSCVALGLPWFILSVSAASASSRLQACAQGAFFEMKERACAHAAAQRRLAVSGQ